MENLGEKLKQARLAKNLSLDEIHKITRINKNYLTALETSNVKAFPAEVYYKNFLKRYASYLGLNGEQILQEYNDSKKQEGNKIIHKKVVSKQKTAKNKRDFFIVIIFVILIVLLILMNYFIKTDAVKTEQEIDNLMNVTDTYFAKEKTNDENVLKPDNNSLQKEKQSEQKTPEQKQEDTNKPQPKDVQQTEPVTNEPAVVTETPAQTQQNSAVSEKKQKLIVKAISDTWVDIYADGKRKYTGYIFSGNQTFVVANEVFNIKIGDITGVEVFFNDVKVDVSSGAAENNVNSLELKKQNEQ